MYQYQRTRNSQPVTSDRLRGLNYSQGQSQIWPANFRIWDLLAAGTKHRSVASVTCFCLLFVFLGKGNQCCVLRCAISRKLSPNKSVGHEWSLFIDSSKLILKGVLLLNENKHPCAPQHLSCKQQHRAFKHIPGDKYSWHNCQDMRAISLRLSLHLSYTNFCLFLCEWDSQAREGATSTSDDSRTSKRRRRKFI